MKHTQIKKTEVVFSRSGVARTEDIAYRAAQTALAAAGPGWTMAVSYRPYAPAGRQWHWELIRQEGEAA